MNKSLSYFMKGKIHAEEIVVRPMPDSYTDENGKVLDMEIRTIPRKELLKIERMYKTRKTVFDKSGRPLLDNGTVVYEEMDDVDKRLNAIITEALVYPNLKDPELMASHGCVAYDEMVDCIFPTMADFKHVLDSVLEVVGLKKGTESTAEQEIEDAKN